MKSKYWKMSRWHTESCKKIPKHPNGQVFTTHKSDLPGVIAYKTSKGNVKVLRCEEGVNGFISMQDLVENNTRVRKLSFKGIGRGDTMNNAILAGRKVYGFYNAYNLFKDWRKIKCS